MSFSKWRLPGFKVVALILAAEVLLYLAGDAVGGTSGGTIAVLAAVAAITLVILWTGWRRTARWNRWRRSTRHRLW